MKTSNRVLLIAGIILVVVMIILGGVFSYTLKSLVSLNSDKANPDFTFEKNMEVYTYSFSDFERIDVRGKWKISVKRGDEWKVKVGCGKALSDMLKVEQKRDSLYLEFVPGRKFGNKRATAVIVLPRFVGLKGEGGLTLYFEGFHKMDRLNVSFSGGLSLRGTKSDYKQLSLSIDGGGSVDLKDVPVHDADVVIDGAGNVVLSMSGGRLNGEINGAGILTYYGTVKRRNVSINGIGKVYHK